MLKKSRVLIVLALAAAVMLLAACDGALPGELPGSGTEVTEQEGSVEKNIFVGPELVDCVGVAPQTCLQVKEDPNAEYTLWYFPIEGFDFEPGYEYELLVREETIENPPADGSSIKWTLVEEISKTPVETGAAQTGTVTTLYVGPETADCVGVGPQTCLLVREDPNAEYTFFYSTIEGFDYEPGYEYELLVEQTPVENPPADGSSIRWTLVEVVSKTPAQTAVAPDTTDTPGRIVTAFIGPELVDCVGVGPQQCLQYKTNPDDEYALFYDTIEGFEYEAGYEYELRVQIDPVQNPPADASALRYTLVELVSKTPATAVAAPVEGEVMAEAKSLEGPIWVLSAYIGADGQQKDVLPDSRVTATFAEGQVAGTAGCNRYFGSYETDGNGSLTFSPLGSTMMMCMPEELMLQETAFLANMSTVTGYVIQNSQLQLTDAAGQTVLLFDAEEPISLTNTTWIVTGYNNGLEAVVSVLEGTEMTAVFTEDGTVSGSAGCNNYRAGYAVDGENMTVEAAAATRKLCPQEGIMEQEAQFLTALPTTATFRIDGDTLELRDANGAKVAGFRAAAPPNTGADAALIEQPATAESGAALPELAGTAWQWVGMVTPLESTTVDDPARYVVEFLDSGVVGITADCNTGSGSYEASGGQISINITATTLALCPPESRSDEFIRNLNAAAIYFMQGDNLFIDLFADAGTMEFAPR